jgi:hypothetical protein
MTDQKDRLPLAMEPAHVLATLDVNDERARNGAG